jgi:RNA polymerase sigma-70 factor, ECF subfamily
MWARAHYSPYPNGGPGFPSYWMYREICASAHLGSGERALTIQDRVSLGRNDYPPIGSSDRTRDRLLVEAHLRGDDDAFAIIVDDHRQALLAQARRMLSGSAAEDAVQETFVRALKYLRTFGRTGDYRLGAWLSSILKRVALDYRSRAYRDLRIAQAEASAALVTYEADVADRVGDPVTAAALQEALLELPTTQRAAFVMREMEGLAYADVAQVLNISEENVRARVSRSKTRLRQTAAKFRTAAGALIGLPIGLRAFQPKATTRAIKTLNRGKDVFGTGERVAGQITMSSAGQAALTFVSSGATRGTFVFGLAATVATLSASTVVLASSDSHASASAPASAVSVSAVVPTPDAASAPVADPKISTAVNSPASSTTQPAPTYGWANPSSSGPNPAASLPVATCSSTNGVSAPGAGFDFGTALGVSNAQSVISAPPIALTTVGSSFHFTAPVSFSPFGGSQSLSGSASSDVCLSSTGSWFTASVTLADGSVADLQGTLQMVIGSGSTSGYIFRGIVESSATSPSSFSGVVQFVADVSVVEPDNTAQLTVVLMGETATVAPTSTPTQPTSSTTTSSSGDESGSAAPTNGSGSGSADASGTSSQSTSTPPESGGTGSSSSGGSSSTSGSGGGSGLTLPGLPVSL